MLAVKLRIFLFYSETHCIGIHSRMESKLSLNIIVINANYTEFRMFIERIDINNQLVLYV